MRKLTSLLFLVLLSLGLSAAPAVAASPHFIGTPTASTSGTTVTVSFKAAGLGNVTTATFTLTGSAEALYGCFTKSGNHPQAANKEGPTTVSATGTFPVRNGQTTGSLSVSLPASTLDCPRGQHVELISGSITGLTLSGMGLTFTFGTITF